jgi:ABC-type lipoprotein release transport system permease subunit
MGFMAGRCILEFRNVILSALTYILSGWHSFTSLKSYTYLPVHYESQDFFSIFFFANSICLLAGLIPSWKASKISPARALRVEN